jgi:hypothetical protein
MAILENDLFFFDFCIVASFGYFSGLSSFLFLSPLLSFLVVLLFVKEWRLLRLLISDITVGVFFPGQRLDEDKRRLFDDIKIQVIWWIINAVWALGADAFGGASSSSELLEWRMMGNDRTRSCERFG